MRIPMYDIIIELMKGDGKVFDTNYNYRGKRKVAIYARVSTEHEAQLSALANQKDWYSPILGIHPEWEVVKLYADEGVTGTAAYKRRSFMQMIDDALNGKFSLILTREVSRFARNTVDTLNYTRKLKKHNVEVYFISDGIKTFDPDGELRLTIMATLAQDESRKTSARVKCGQQTSMEKGVVYGNGNVLGYDRVGRELVVNTEQADTVRKIFKWYAEGRGLRWIMWELEKRGIKTATGRSNWHEANIYRVLQNPIYIGMLTYHKQYVPDYLEQKKVLNHGEMEVLQVRGRHEPIISDEQFERVQQIIAKGREDREKLAASGSKAFARRKSNDIWVNKMQCECGKNFNRKGISKTEDGQTECIYMCHGQVCTGTAAARAKKGLGTESICKVPIIPSWKLQMMAYEVFHACLQDVDTVLELAQGMLEKHINDRADNKCDPVRETEIREEIEELKKRIDRCTELRIDNEISVDIYKRKKAEYEIRINDLRAELDEVSVSVDEDEESFPVKDRVRLLTDGLRAVITDDECDDIYIPEEIIEAFVDRIVVHENSVDWYLRCTGKEEWDELICSGLGEESDERVGRPQRVYYGYMPGGKQRKVSEDEVIEVSPEKEVKATEIMTFVVTREQAEVFRERMGKDRRKIRGWRDIEVRVFV